MKKFKILWLSQATANTGMLSRFAAVDVSSLGVAAQPFLITEEKLKDYGLNAGTKAALVALHPEDAEGLTTKSEISIVDDNGQLATRRGVAYQRNQQKRNARITSAAEALKVAFAVTGNVELAKAAVDTVNLRSERAAEAFRAGGGRQRRVLNLEAQGVSGSI